MKILFHDVDGCLNTEDGLELPHKGATLSEYQAQRLAELGRSLDKSSIDMMVINTGRSLQDTQAIADAIQSDKLAYIIAEHGAVIHHTVSRSLINWNLADADPLVGINNLISWYHSEGKNILSDNIQKHIEELDKIANLTIVVPEGMDSDLMFAEVNKLIDKNSPFDHSDFVFNHSKTDGYVDVMSPIDKGDGLCFIKDLVDATEVQTISVGNGLNDLPMMKKTDLCICPANSEPELIEFCQTRESIISEHAYIDATLNWLKTQ